MSTVKFGLEIPDAVIIGDYVKQGQLFYEGRPQGGKFNGESDSDLRDIAATKKSQLKRSLGAEFDRLFPMPIWELRIWD